MIVTALINLIYNVLDFLFFFSVPSLPDSVVQIVNAACEYMNQGIRIIQAFTGSTALGVIALLVQLVLLAHTIYFGWMIIKFILSHIPFLNVGK